MTIFLLFVVFAVIGYLVGSLSSAIIVCRAMGLPDPRTQGSNNPGATNVMRIGGKKASYLTFLGDFLKGFVVVIMAKFLSSSDWAIAGAGLGAFLGHLYPLYFGFKGGKGVATLVGILLGVSIKLLIVFGIIWIAILYASGYVSLASMLGVIAVTISAIFFSYSLGIILLLSVLALLVIYRHRSNIKKLLNGEENHFKKHKK